MGKKLTAMLVYLKAIDKTTIAIANANLGERRTQIDAIVNCIKSHGLPHHFFTNSFYRVQGLGTCVVNGDSDAAMTTKINLLTVAFNIFKNTRPRFHEVMSGVTMPLTITSSSPNNNKTELNKIIAILRDNFNISEN